jgi:tRNA-uridine 2-sulfurtransferase
VDEAVGIALSGGVDSSVAALLLRREGHTMAGGSFAIRGEPEGQGARRARALCGRLGIPFHAVDAGEAFHRLVVTPFVATYLAGRTPNPCVVCNPAVKFGFFAEELRARMTVDGTLGAGARFLFATGHYARVRTAPGGAFLLRASSTDKDQSYVLYRLPKEVLPYLLFPLGTMRKDEVRLLAERENLEAARAPESQDVCFADGNLEAFLRAEAGASRPLAAGDIVDMRGNRLGRHRGTALYTVGQRQGLGLGNGPWYVVRIEAEEGRVVVGRAEEARADRFAAADLHWLVDPPAPAFSCTVKVRYRSRDVRCRVEPEGRSAQVVMEGREFVTPGQSAVFYEGEVVLGGGIIL